MSETKSFPADLKQLPQILAWVRQEIVKTQLSDSESMRVELALEEAIVNVIQHGAQDRSFDLSLAIYHGTSQLEFILSDPGPAFNPLAHEVPPRDDLPLQEISLGGLGVPLMHKCMDSLLYRREEGRNVLTLIKQL